jgi:hypothetical protein
LQEQLELLRPEIIVARQPRRQDPARHQPGHRQNCRTVRLLFSPTLPPIKLMPTYHRPMSCGTIPNRPACRSGRTCKRY